MEIQFDSKLTATVDELQTKMNLASRAEVITRAVSLLKVCSEGVAKGERLCLITAETRKEIQL